MRHYILMLCCKICFLCEIRINAFCGLEFLNFVKKSFFFKLFWHRFRLRTKHCVVDNLWISLRKTDMICSLQIFCCWIFSKYFLFCIFIRVIDMAVVCSQCGRQYDITLFEYGGRVECDCGNEVKIADSNEIRLEKTLSPEEMLSELRKPKPDGGW